MQTLFDALGIEEIRICDAAMREGLLWDLSGACAVSIRAVPR